MYKSRLVAVFQDFRDQHQQHKNSQQSWPDHDSVSHQYLITSTPTASSPKMSDAQPLSETLLARNALYARTTHQPFPTMAELQAKGIKPPSTIIVSCMDNRTHPSQFLQVAASEALVIRNAGGRITPHIDNIALLDGLFGIEEVLVVMHTGECLVSPSVRRRSERLIWDVDCGTTHTNNEELRAHARKHQEEQYAEEIDGMDFGALGHGADIETALRDQIARFTASHLIRQALKDGTHGYLYDIESGVVKQVC